jgi:adenine-specific DNA methylase
MTDSNEQDSENSDLKSLLIEGELPLKAVGIENLKEANPKHMPPHRYLHPWFARRPTPASRLAILGSILPSEVESDDLLRWMQIGPNSKIDQSIAEYVEQKKARESEKDGTLGEHYGYPRPFTQSPSETERNEIHQLLRSHWGGELPTVLDPTAGGGVIPFESLRYGLPTKANELNPVPSMILNVLLEFAPEVGSIREEAEIYGKKIRERAKSKLEAYYPSTQNGQKIDSYVATYSVDCPTCGCDIPLVPKWWIRNPKSGKAVVAKPSVQDGNVSFECIIVPSSEDLEDFDPSEGTVSSGGDAQCIDCGVVYESDDIQEEFSQGNFEHIIYCVKYRKPGGGSGYRAPCEEDRIAMQKAEDRISNDYELSSLLTTEIPSGQKTGQIKQHGINQWRDMFSPRQLVAHFEYLKSLEYHIDELCERYEEYKTELLVTVFALTASKMITYNSRLSSWHMGKGYPDPIFKRRAYDFQRVYVDNNMSVGSMGHESHFDKIVESYEEIIQLLPENTPKGEVTKLDAANLNLADESVHAIIVDPPYYSSIMYAELSDVFYVWMKKYLSDFLPEFFQGKLTDKENEAVANPGRFDDIAGNGVSKKDLANEYYESKMSDIFSELYRVLEPGGVMTVMFTHKETDAWDTLTMSLINSGFIITSTHPITSEMPQRAGMQNSASADSTLLLTGRKPIKKRYEKNTLPTLWSDVESDTRSAAKLAARDLIDSGLSLTKTDVIISAFGPTLRVFADAYPVVDDEDKEVKPRRALEEAREAVSQVLVEEYLDVEGIEDLDDVSEWYILSWLVHEAETFSYDEGHQLGLGIGVDIDEIKRSTKTWRKSGEDMSLRGHSGRVQNIEKKPENRSSHTPVNPDSLSFGLALDKIHAAMHVYDVQGESACCDWLRERNFDSDSTFKATLKALLQVLPHEHEDWVLARDIAVGRTRDVLNLEFSPNVFAEDTERTQQTGFDDY